MKYTVRTSIVRVVGHIWMPNAVASMSYTLSDYDLQNIREEAEYRAGSPAIDREAIDQWLATHAGDFQSIDDFSASIEDGDLTVDLPWATEEGEMAYCDTLGGCE